MKPDWDKLMREYRGSTIAGVYDVDCTGAGKGLCQQAGVRGYPTILHGDPSNVAAMQKYNGGRTFDALSRFAKVNLEGDKSAGKEPAPPPPSHGKAPEKRPPPPPRAKGGKRPLPPPSGKKMPPGRVPGRGQKPRPSSAGGKKGAGNEARREAAMGDRRAKHDARAQAAAAARAKRGKKGLPLTQKAKSDKLNQKRVEAQRRAAEKKKQGEARRHSVQAAARRQQQEKARVVNANIKSKEL